MALVKGIFKQLTIAEETTYGTPAGTGSGQNLRRINGAMQLTKDVYTSQEIIPSQQQRVSRHGVRRVAGTLSGQLSPGAYTNFIEGMLRRDFTVGATVTLSNVTAAAGPPGTFTRATGSWLTDGFKVGDVVRHTGWTTGGVSNNSRNYRIKDLTATVMTVLGTGNEIVASKAAGDSVTVALAGKKTFIPSLGQVLQSYTVEQWFPDADTAISERFVGCRVAGLRFNLPATGLLTCEAQLIGQDMLQGTAQYFTNPTPANNTTSLAAVSGVIRFGGVDVASITGCQLGIQSAMEANPVMGSNIVPEVFPGMVQTSGQLSVYVRDQTLMNAFIAEAEYDLHLYMTTDPSINADFMAITMNRVKINSATKSDSDRSIIQSVSFEALEHVAGAGAGTKFEATSISVQDSSI